MARCESCGTFSAGTPRGWRCQDCELNEELGRLEAALAAGHSDPGDEERAGELRRELAELAELGAAMEAEDAVVARHHP